VFSDIVYFILYYLIGYRKKVVWQNLKNSFPQKTDEEIDRTRKKFYHYFCDLFIEFIKALTISKKSIVARCKFTPEGMAVLNTLAGKNKSILLVMGHFGNWEWAGQSFSLLCRHRLYVIYHQLGNKHFNDAMTRLRSRFGTGVIEMKRTYKEMLSHKNILNATVFLADQTPQPDNAYWMTFLNQDTPVFKGTEVIAKKLGLPVVYANVTRLKRGYYEMHLELLVEFPADTADGEITEMHTKRLEQDIIAMPETWLWSHRRWKHKRKNTHDKI
jgi:KDO2-lipid IV(A) lauroyltransferase